MLWITQKLFIYNCNQVIFKLNKFAHSKFCCTYLERRISQFAVLYGVGYPRNQANEPLNNR